jgi:hypothetical protein
LNTSRLLLLKSVKIGLALVSNNDVHFKMVWVAEDSIGGGNKLRHEGFRLVQNTVAEQALESARKVGLLLRFAEHGFDHLVPSV